MRALVSILIGCLGTAGLGFAQEVPRDLKAAAAAADAAFAAGEWATAEVAYREAAVLLGERMRTDPGNLDLANARNAYVYNAACSAALQHQAAAAFELLEGLVASRWYDNTGLLDGDSDLASLRENRARFDALLARAAAVRAAATAGHVEGRILRPRRLAQQGVPGIVVLHGGGGNVEVMVPAFQAVAERTGAIVILVRGVIIQGEGAFSYAQREPARDVARIEEWIAKARAEVPALDDGELFLSGFSQGGGMAWVLGLRGERQWRGVIPIGGYVQVAARAGVMGEPDHPVAVFALVGDHDEDAIREINEKLVAQEGLTRLRAHLETIEGAGHVLPADLPFRVLRAMKWCRRSALR